VAVGRDAVVHRCHRAVDDDERRPARDPAVCRHAERRTDLAVRVGQQVELDAVLVGEGGVGVDAVDRDPVDGDAGLAVGRQFGLELAGFDGTARRVVGRVEVDDRDARPVRAHRLAVLVGRAKLRRRVAGFDRHSTGISVSLPPDRLGSVTARTPSS